MSFAVDSFAVDPWIAAGVLACATGPMPTTAPHPDELRAQ